MVFTVPLVTFLLFVLLFRHKYLMRERGRKTHAERRRKWDMETHVDKTMAE